MIVEGTVINAENIDYDKFTKILHEVTDYSLKNLSDDSDVLWIFGYMISLFLHYFYEHEE